MIEGALIKVSVTYDHLQHFSPKQVAFIKEQVDVKCRLWMEALNYLACL